MIWTALRGQFNGVGAIERAHKAFMAGEIKQTGVMIHYVSYISMVIN
jgi:phosphoribosylglycinamide formyltransferase